jgi:hypothetical protein
MSNALAAIAELGTAIRCEPQRQGIEVAKQKINTKVGKLLS